MIQKHPRTYAIVNAADKVLRMIIPLKHLLSSFNDYNMVAYGRQTICLAVIKRDGSESLIIRDGKTKACN